MKFSEMVQKQRQIQKRGWSDVSSYPPIDDEGNMDVGNSIYMASYELNEFAQIIREESSNILEILDGFSNKRSDEQFEIVSHITKLRNVLNQIESEFD